MKSNNPKISIIIVNLNGKSYLASCLKSIEKNSYKNFEIILVDNNSTDGSIDFVRKNFPNVKIFKLNTNYGFAEPSNIGAKNAKGELLYFLNNDTTLCHDSLAELIKIIQKPEIAICQSLLLKPDNTIDSSGDFITTMGIPYSSKKKATEITPILSARGASMMIKKQIFYELGGFDKQFFASFEDVDLGWRAWISGYKVFLVPTSTVYHLGGKTVSMLDSKIRFHGTKNTLLLCLVNFESTFAVKSLIRLGGAIIAKKFSRQFNEENSELFILPSFPIIIHAVKWIIKNYKHITTKRKKLNSQRVRSTNELINLGLITKNRI